jgi:hypothetical protein
LRLTELPGKFDSCVEDSFLACVSELVFLSFYIGVSKPML